MHLKNITIFDQLIIAMLAAVYMLFAAVVPVHSADVTPSLKGRAVKWQGRVVDLGPLKNFYRARYGRGIWTDDKGLNKAGESLVVLLNNAAKDGLSSGDYIRKFPNKIKKKQLANAELYLSQAMWRFGRDLYTGRTTPSVSDPDIVIARKRIDIAGWLTTANRRGPTYLFDSLRPPHSQYAALRKLLAKTKGRKKRRKIIVNMERWRWLPRDMGKRHVLVNQAAFEVYIRQKEKIVDRRKVVIGKRYHKTPIFSHSIKFAEFNPTWTVTRSIAGEEFLPRLRRNSRYLEKRGFKLFESWDKDAEEIDATKINWRSVSSKDFPYRIVQKPGKTNALGKVKFVFPNRFKVYMHDTPSKRLFKQSSRAYSHGCIRVEKPLEFATKLFQSQRLTMSKINKILATKETTRMKMRKKLPVHLAYFTMWIEANGKLKSYKDVYNRDRMVAKILFGGA